MRRDITFDVDKAAWRRLSWATYRRSRWSRLGVGMAVTILVVSAILALAAYRLTLSGAGGWDDPESGAQGFAGSVLVMGPILALVAIAQTWYRANGTVGMRCDQHAMMTGEALVYSFRLRGSLYRRARTIIICKYDCVDHATYDASSETITVYGGIWVGVTADVRHDAPEGRISGSGYYVIPNCLVPDLVGALSRVCSVQRA